jgi:hypothetical protein
VAWTDGGYDQLDAEAAKMAVVDALPCLASGVVTCTQWASKEIVPRNLVEMLINTMSVYREILKYDDEKKWSDPS